MGIIRAPFSNLTVANSMAGKSHFWRTLLSHSDTVFYPKVSKYYIFGHLNLTQYDGLKALLGAENVHVCSVKELPGMVFPKYAFVWIDELNSALVGLKAQEKAGLISSLTSLYNETVHHSKLYLVCNLQQLFHSDLFFLVGISQSLSLSTLSNDSLKIMQRAQLSPEIINRVSPLLSTMRLTMKPQFILIYHNASALSPFIHSFIWTYLDLLPHLAIAIGQERTFPDFLPKDFEVVTRRNVGVAMESPEAKNALRVVNSLPEPLRAKTFALVPVSSISKTDLGPEEEAEPLGEQQVFDDLDRLVMEMLCECCSVQQLSMYRKLWYFIKHQPEMSICSDGLVLYCNGNQINLLTLLKECLKMPPPVKPFAATNKKKKKDETLLSCIPFVAELLQNTSFPSHLIKNTQLKALASKKVKK